MTRNKWIASFTVLMLALLGGVAYAAGQKPNPKQAEQQLKPKIRVKTVVETRKVRVVRMRKPEPTRQKTSKPQSTGTLKASVEETNNQSGYNKPSPAPKVESGASPAYDDEEEEYEEEEEEEGDD